MIRLINKRRAGKIQQEDRAAEKFAADLSPQVVGGHSPLLGCSDWSPWLSGRHQHPHPVLSVLRMEVGRETGPFHGEGFLVRKRMIQGKRGDLIFLSLLAQSTSGQTAHQGMKGAVWRKRRGWRRAASSTPGSRPLVPGVPVMVVVLVVVRIVGIDVAANGLECLLYFPDALYL